MIDSGNVLDARIDPVKNGVKDVMPWAAFGKLNQGNQFPVSLRTRKSPRVAVNSHLSYSTACKMSSKRSRSLTSFASAVSRSSYSFSPGRKTIQSVSSVLRHVTYPLWGHATHLPQ